MAAYSPPAPAPMDGDTEMTEVSNNLPLGRAIMERHGWVDGTGLGPAAGGMLEPLQAQPQRRRYHGIGAHGAIRRPMAEQSGGDGYAYGQQVVSGTLPAQSEPSSSFSQISQVPTGLASNTAPLRQYVGMGMTGGPLAELQQTFLSMTAQQALIANLTLGGQTDIFTGSRILRTCLERIDEKSKLVHDSALIRQLPRDWQLYRNAIFGASCPLSFENSVVQACSTPTFGLEYETGLKEITAYNWRENDDREHLLANSELEPIKPSMADFSHADQELQSLNHQVIAEPEEFEHWEKLVRACESQEGGLNRNSSPQAIASTRDVYDRFLSRFPLFFGYWKKYADLEFAIAGTEAAEMVYERGVASIGISVDLWANYCGFKTETNHDIDLIRELFERGAESVGLDFHAHPFWDKYLEFEERLEAHDRAFEILARLIHIPMHQYARYFERYRNMAQKAPVDQLAPEGILAQFTSEIQAQGGPKTKNPADLDREIRTRIENYHMEIFQRTQTETTKRWTYEQEVKRPYFHVTELDEPQLANWRKYLDFEEAEGDYTRIKFLYERCLVTAANYDEFWFRYASWMRQQGDDKEQEIRNIYQRASYLYVPIARPAVRLFWSKFEESINQLAIAADILDAILSILPSHAEAILALVNLHRRQYGVDSAIGTLKKYIDSFETSQYVRGTLVAEWARLTSQINGQVDEARKLFQGHYNAYLDCRPFWLKWFFFEVNQPAPDAASQKLHNERVEKVYKLIRTKSSLSPATIEDVKTFYMAYLEERGPQDAMKAYMWVEAEIDIQRLAGENEEAGTNGHGNASEDLQNPYAKAYSHQDEEA